MAKSKAESQENSKTTTTIKYVDIGDIVHISPEFNGKLKTGETFEVKNPEIYRDNHQFEIMAKGGV
jgi:hypothetical protein